MGKPVAVPFWPGEYVVLAKEDWSAVEAVLDRARREFGPLNLKLTQTSLTVPASPEPEPEVKVAPDVELAATDQVKRFWASWKEPIDDTGDYRPMSWPLPASIPAFWCSGEGDGYVTLCAVIDAHSKADVEEIVGRCWKPSGWRFIEKKDADWRPQSDRFPWPEWSEE